MEDTEIITLLTERKESALDEIICRYGRLLKSFAGRILPSAQDVEECVNDVLLDIWNTIPPKGDSVICRSEYTKGLHSQIYSDDPAEASKMTAIYCIDLEQADGKDLIGKELTVQLLYAEGGDGFTSTFTPVSCFPGRSWDIGRTYEFGEHSITLKSVRESALYVTLFIDCATIGHTGDDYTFILSDELGNDYTVYPYEDNDVNGYWYTKPDTMGTRLTLKIIRSNMKSSPYGEITDDSYEVLYEIPIDLAPTNVP